MKKLFLVLLCIILACSFASCGGSAEDAASPPSETDAAVALTPVDTVEWSLENSRALIDERPEGCIGIVIGQDLSWYNMDDIKALPSVTTDWIRTDKRPDYDILLMRQFTGVMIDDFIQAFAPDYEVTSIKLHCTDGYGVSPMAPEEMLMLAYDRVKQEGTASDESTLKLTEESLPPGDGPLVLVPANPENTSDEFYIRMIGVVEFLGN